MEQRKRAPAPTRSPAPGGRWYVLVHQLPPKPLYLRAKVRQRLVKVGAVLLKNSVYVLPRSEDALEDLQWIVQEAAAGGGEAHVFEATFVVGVSDEELVRTFRKEREADYAGLEVQAREALSELKSRSGVLPPEAELASRLGRLKKRLEEIGRIDFFAAEGRSRAVAALRTLEEKLQPARPRPARPAKHADLQGRTWVTRRGIKVDRIASAWFVRRFLDKNARFRFVDAKGETAPGEIRFDMVPGDFTHEGNRCTFETLLSRTGLTDPSLRSVAEIVHDIDLKDGKFGRPDAPGIERLLSGLVLSHAGDEERLERGFALFDDLYQSFPRTVVVTKSRRTRRAAARKKRA